MTVQDDAESEPTTSPPALASPARLLDAIGNENGKLIARFALQALTAMSAWEPES